MASGFGDHANHNFETRLNEIEDLVKAGDSIAALAIVEELISAGICTRLLYDLAAKATVNAIVDQVWDTSRAEALLGQLILQSDLGTPPALHHEIASRHSAGQANVRRQVAKAFKPLLSRLWNEGRRDRNFLLIVLLLRDQLRGWRPEEEISRWHIDALRDFTRSDMAIPYNMIFDVVSFALNVDDLRDILDKAPVAELARYGAWKLFLMQIITDSPRLDHDLPAIIAACDAYSSAESADEQAGIKSLRLRAAAKGRQPVPSSDEIDAFVTEWAAFCAPAHPQPFAASRAALARVQSRKWQVIRAGLDIAQRKAPFLRIPGRRKPRIALCISGQFRGYQKAFGTWREGILRDTETEIFVHSWSRIGQSGAEPFRSFLPFEGAQFCATYRAQAHGIPMPELHSRYPALFKALQETGEVTKDEISAFYETSHVVLQDDAGPEFIGWSNSAKMHYKIGAVASLAETSGFDADLFLRVRPDKQLGLVALSWSDVLAATAGHAVIFADFAMGQQYATPMLGDQIALGRPGAMAIYAATHRMAPRLAEHRAFAAKPNFEGHVSLAVTCWHGGLSVQRLPVRMGALMEAELLSLASIAQCLETDTAGRMDTMDSALLAAVGEDLASRVR